MAGGRDPPAKPTTAGPDGRLSAFGVVEGRHSSGTVRLGEILAATDFRQPAPMRGPDRFTKCWMRTPKAFRDESKMWASLPTNAYLFDWKGTENLAITDRR
jgi:hypothetical protein